MNKWVLKRRILQVKVGLSKILCQSGAKRSELMRKSGLIYHLGGVERGILERFQPSRGLYILMII